MAQPTRTRGRRAEPEEAVTLQRIATQAADAFRDYIATGVPSYRETFRRLYDANSSNSVFMGQLYTDLERIGADRRVQPYLDAFIADRGRLFGFLWRNPAHFTDFIDTVYNIRTTLERGTATDAAVTALARRYRELGTRPVRADTDLARVRSSVQGGMGVEDAARQELERPSREEARQRYGEDLANAVIARMTSEQARRAAVALRDFMLSGNDARRQEFRRIFDANNYQAFTEAFTREFTARIYNDSASGLAAVARAYNTHHRGTEPNEFATMVANLYTAASTGTAQQVETLRTAEGTDVIDPLLNLVARGMARRAIGLLRDVLESGTPASRDAFASILGGRLAVVVDGNVQMPIVENNDVFWNEFTTLYTSEISRNSRLATLSRSFSSNILAIAIRDIYTELARASPDRARLVTDYGPDMVREVEAHFSNLAWILRPEGDVNAELTRRARAEESAAVQITALRIRGQGRALTECYTALVEERRQRRGLEAPDVIALIEQNYDALSYLSGDPAAVQRELDRRARLRTPEPLAVQLRGRFPTNAGKTLSEAYARITALRQRRAQLASQYGQEFVTIVDRNLDNLGWLVRPVQDIDTQMRSRREEAAVVAVNTRIGYSIGTLSHALRVIYNELGGASPDRARLDARYGSELVALVADNRASLTWLGRDFAGIERTLQDPSTDRIIRQLQSRIYSYSPVQLVSAITRARAAVSRGGLALAEARDAYGDRFIPDIAAVVAVRTPSLAPEAAQGQQAQIQSTARRIESEIQSLESQMRYAILEPARGVLREQIRLWRQENNRLRDLGAATTDPAELTRITTDMGTLYNRTMLQASDLRRSVEMAFAMVHLAETGADLYRPSVAGVTFTDSTVGTLRTLLTWYQGLDARKQATVGRVVAAVMQRADSRLFQFMLNMDQPSIFQGLTSVYGMTQRRGGTTRASLEALYGPSFVSLVEGLAPNLRVLESPAVTMTDLQRGENRLFADITIRVYRAITSPREGENREAMVRLFGTEFVTAVETNREQLSTLAASGAGLSEVSALPRGVKSALLAAYVSAYNRTITHLVRAYRKQDGSLFDGMVAVHAVMRDRPARGAPAETTRAFESRVQELYSSYGQRFVRSVSDNMAQLGFLESPSASVTNLSALPPELLETLNSTFESGPGVAGGTFMANYVGLATAIPQVYTQLRSALVFSNASASLGTNFQAALALYRQHFGSDNYLFNQYINLELFSNSLSRLRERYPSVTFPASIETPEALVAFLSSEAGQRLVNEGRTAYEELERSFIQGRTDANYHPTTGDLSDDNVTALRNEISIIDALYLGMAMPSIQSMGSSFSRNAALAMMNSLLIIQHRDPYLVAPFLIQVLPAIISVSQDERTIVASLEAFNAIFLQRFEAGSREIAYSSALNRQYLLGVFTRLGEQLPALVSSYDHNRLSDEMRLQPEPMTDEGYLSPLLYRQRSGWWQGEGLEPLPPMWGQFGAPLSLIPRPYMSLSTSLPSPTGGRVESGAMEFYTRNDQSLRPPLGMMFRQRVPARFRIGALGSSTIIRRINQLFGPMPVDYNDYWLSMSEELGGYYQRQVSGTRTTDTGGVAGIVTGRTVSGGERGTVRYTGGATDTTVPAPTTSPTTTVTETTHQLDVTAQAVRLPMPISGPVPLPLLGLVPYNLFQMGEGTGIHRARQEFHYETASTQLYTQGAADASGRRPAPQQTYDVQTRGRTRGLLDTYQRIARDSATDMLLFVAGEQVPERRGIPPTRADIAQRLGITEAQYNGMTETDLRALSDRLGFSLDEVRQGAVSQPTQGNLRSRLYFVTRTGDIYQLAYGAHTESQLMNYLYAGANTQQALASARFLGREMLPGIPLTDGERRTRLGTALSLSAEQVRTMSDAEIDRRLSAAGTSRSAIFGSPIGGFDGGAVGITLPMSGGDSFSALAFGELVRSLRTMEPVHGEQAVGMAVTNLLADRRQRDVYAAFYRGAEIVTQDPADRSHISDSSFAQATGEVMWRRVRIDPMAYQAEVRAVGGYPTTAGIRGRLEWRPTRYRTNALGVTAAYSSFDLMREFRAVDTDASEIYSRMNNVLVNLYHWSEDTARDTGHLVSGSYMYSRLEDWVARDPSGSYTTEATQPGSPNQHFASAMMMYWAQRHGILVGAQRVPGWSRIYDRIDRAMMEVARNPTAESTVLRQLSQQLQQDLQRDIWRFALAYGYDGESVKVYVAGGGQWTGDETAYGNLRGMMLFGRPVWGYADIVGHAYTYSPVVLSEDSTQPGNFRQETAQRNPYVDLYAGFGLVDWPAIQLHRFSREATIRPTTDISTALRDVYRDMGSIRNRSRMVRVYGETFVSLSEGAREGLAWLIRPPAEIRTELQSRLDADDPLVLSIMSLRRGVDSGRQGVRAEDAAAIIDIYRELRKAVPDRARLATAYPRELVEMVEGRSVDLDFILLPQERMRQEFERRSQRSGTPEHRMAEEARIPAAPAQESVTGQELRRMIEQNMLEFLFGTRPDLQSKVGLSSERYDVILGTHLNSPAGRNKRSRVFYVLHTPVGERADSRGALVIGDQADLDEWVRSGHAIGRGITRLEMSKEGSDYHLTFLGNQRATTLSAVRLVGGVSIPIRPDDYSRYRPEANWTVGGLLSLYQDHRLDILGGALYGTRQFGNERWDQWQIALSGRLQGTSTATFTEQWYGYVFFNQMTKRMVFASGDVFSNADEMRDVCTRVSGAACSNLSELSRTTGGAGITWARTDVITGDRLSFHLFFEAGAESYTRATTPTYDQTPSRDATPIWRTGLGFEYLRQSQSSAIPTIYSLTFGAQSGSWPLLPGDVTRPEYFNQWGGGIETHWPGSLILGGNVTIRY